MMCDECGQNPATIHIATIIGGNKKDENLCPQCWQKRNAQLLGGLQVGDLLSKLLSAKQKQDKPEAQEEKIELYCDSCGMSYHEFQKTGRVGCAHCYSVFGAHMEKTLKSIHGHARHVGKAPAYLAGEMDAHRQLEELRKAMEEAVAVEDFEQAAVLRDRIRAIQLEQMAKNLTAETEEQADE